MIHTPTHWWLVLDRELLIHILHQIFHFSSYSGVCPMVHVECKFLPQDWQIAVQLYSCLLIMRLPSGSRMLNWHLETIYREQNVDYHLPTLWPLYTGAITRYLGNMCYNLLPRQHLRYYCKISISLILVFSSFESQVTLNNYHLQFHHFKNGYILVQYILTRPSVLVYWSAVTSFLFVTPSFVFTITDRIGMYYKNWREGLGMRLERSIYIKYTRGI